VPADVPVCKVIADNHKHELGFLPRAVFAEAIVKHNLLVAQSMDTGTVVAFVRYNHRKKGFQTAIYDICVDRNYYGMGVGRALVQALATDCRSHARTSIVLKCPEDLHANEFYRSAGFQRMGVVAGRRRSLVIWQLELS
jgi:ribosomal protein S18 acetylase RimI-like enzyme